MRLEWILDFKINSLEIRFLVDLIIGIGAFFAGVFFDAIAKKFYLYHAEGFGSGQVIWCAIFGGYVIWTIYQMRDWKE